MVFSSAVFLFFFLPITLIGYYFVPVKGRNNWLLLCSVIFYAWGGIGFLPVIVYAVLLNYSGGLLINHFEQKGECKKKKAFFLITLLLNLANLIYWKYAIFLIETWNDITGVKITIPDIVLPIGISFFTFQSMSYVIDLYRGEVKVQKNIGKLATYIFLFPQLIAGPIVRYIDMEKQMDNRDCQLADVVAGIRIFTIGLAKKAILANSVGKVADEIFDGNLLLNTRGIVWLGLICYTFQLFFDFSGYSDMAIGLGRMFGFHFPKNFNYPFISSSMTEFWRRWHISLSSWFRDYVYIPLGGNRSGNVYLNLLIVFLLTGIWHGASWNFVIWGIYFGVIVVIERFKKKKIKRKLVIWKPIKIAFTMLLWTLSMVWFRTANLQDSQLYFKMLFGKQQVTEFGYKIGYYLDCYLIVILVLCCFFALPFDQKINEWLKQKLSETGYELACNMWSLLLLGASVLYIVTESYNPFIYFQF